MDWLRNLWNRFNANQKTFFDISVDKQKDVLNSLPVPHDDIQRSYNQYCCQQYFIGKFKQFVLNIFALPLLIAFFLKPYSRVTKNSKFSAVAILDGKGTDIISEKLRSEYSRWHYILGSNEGEYFGKHGKSIFVEIFKRYPFSWMFLLKCLIKIRMYNYIVETYSPKAIVVCNEYSFTSSVLTRFCELSGVKHIDVMHGEKLYDITDSFFRYHRCLVWDNFYVKLFESMKAENSQFAVSIPPALRFSSSSISQKYDYIYYLGNETNDELNKIVSVLKSLEACGNVVAVRPHPRYTRKNEFSALIGEVPIDDYNEVSIEQSILSTKNVISLFSTVLNQAYHNGVHIIIDDVTNPLNYRKLKELNYIMLSVSHTLLSKCMEDLGIKIE